MKLSIALAAVLMTTSIAMAQTTPSAPSTSSLTPAQQANRDRIQGERKTCHDQAQSQGLKGPAIRSAVIDCMSKVDPKVAKRMTCRQAGMAKSLSGDDLHKSVQECMKST